MRRGAGAARYRGGCRAGNGLDLTFVGYVTVQRVLGFIQNGVNRLYGCPVRAVAVCHIAPGAKCHHHAAHRFIGAHIGGRRNGLACVGAVLGDIKRDAAQGNSPIAGHLVGNIKFPHIAFQVAGINHVYGAIAIQVNWSWCG